MKDRLLEFARLCRQNGLRVSTSEVLDATRAIELVGLGESATLRAALEATLVKRKSDADLFGELFDLYFLRRGELLAGAEVPPLIEALRKQGLTDDEIEALVALLAEEAARMQPLLRASLGLRRTQLEGLLRLAGIQIDLSRLQNPLQVGFFTQQLLEQLGMRGAASELTALEGRLGRKVGAERAQQIADFARRNLDQLRSSVRGYVSEEFSRRHVDYTQQMRKQLLADKPFSAMSEAELRKLRTEVTRLAQKLRQMVSLRRKVRRRGRLDPRRTMRRAMATGGVPFRLVLRRRRVERPRLVVLCDISDSVRHVSRFMLQFAFTLQSEFSRVRSFVFVSDLGECTDLFKEHEIQRAIDLTCGGAVIGTFANSNFGRAFRIFTERYLDAVTSRTTVLVIGDGRNNYHPPEAWALGDIRARAKKVLWLNPESPVSWAFGDSAMRDYEPHCDRVEVVNNLASLAKLVDTLVL